MSAQEIIAEMPKLKPEELHQPEAKVHELLLPSKSTAAKSCGEALLKVAGSVKDLPPDYPENLDHYLHGVSEEMKRVFGYASFVALLSARDR